MQAAKHKDLRLFLRLARQVRPYWLPIAGLVLLSLIATPLALLGPVPLRLAVDSVINDHPLPGVLRAFLPSSVETSKPAILLFIAAFVVVIVLLNQLQALGAWLLRTHVGERIALDFRTRLFRQVQRFSLAYHDTKGTFDSTYRIQHDAPAIQHIVIDGLTTFLSAFFTLVGMIWVTAGIDLQLAMVALTVAPVLFLMSHGASRRIRRHWKEMKEQESSALSVIQEVLSVVRVVKAFGKEEHEENRFVRHSHESVRKRMRLALFQGGFDLVIGLVIAAGTGTVLFLGVERVRGGHLTIGQLFMVMAYLAQLYTPLRTLSNKVTDIQSSLASAERAFALLDEKPDVAEKPDALRVQRARGAVAFENVRFAYDPERPILKNLSFELKPGARVGVVGKTGAGKTTLLNLLVRFYDPTEGRVLLDGADLRDYKLADLRNQFAIVFQEPVLFSTSIAENIAYAKPSASEQEIRQAAAAANAHDFILRLPQGYDTRVGERGMKLSGGERQRISLARAFLKDAPILILDEPTSAVDVKTEAAIMEAIDRLMNGRTTFMVAHRLSTLAKCDVLLRIEAGTLTAPISPPSDEELRAPLLSKNS